MRGQAARPGIDSRAERHGKADEWPTSIDLNLRLQGHALGHVTSSTDFMLPYTFGVELMGNKATVRDTLSAWISRARSTSGWTPYAAAARRT